MAMTRSLRNRHFGSQPDHDTYIQDFLKWSKSPESFRIGCGGVRNEEERRYIPLKKLKERLTRRRVEGLLEALFEDEDRSAPNVDIIISHYLRPFAILLCIGEGSMIYQFVKHRSLRDDRLPLSQEPSEFPSSTRCDIWTAFRQDQWKFCAQTLEFNTSINIEPEFILPINHKEKIAEGGSSITYKIIVDKDYDSLVPSKPADSDSQHQNTYVLKTYQTTDAQTYYDTEQEAFKRLQDDGKPSSNIIGFYCGFVFQETYNIILEYADLGNLDDYMEKIPPPSTTQEKMTFWGNFLAVLNGLVKIHGEGENDPDIFQILLGWHQDVNPFNILVKSRSAGYYDCDFKLADLGLSHFEKHLSDLRNVSTKEKFDTSAYARRYDEKLQRCNLKIKQNVDIWSLSCVFSEVAIWVNKGWEQLAEYRNRRIQEMERRTGKSEDCFHDGRAVLEAVGQSHDDIMANRAKDPITPKVVKSIIGDMLLFEEKARSEASSMYYKSTRVIRETYAEIRDAQSPALAATHGVHPRSIDVNRPPLRDPPNLPPNHQRRSGKAALVDRPYAAPKVWGSQRLSPPEGNDQVPSGSSRASRQFDAYPDHHDETYEQSSSTTAHLLPLRPALRQDGYSSGRSRGRSSSYDHYDQRPEAHTIFSNINNKERGHATFTNDPFSDLSEVNHRVASNQPSRRHSHHRSFHALSHLTSDADREDPSWENAGRDISYSVASTSFEATSPGILPPNQTLSTPDRDLAVPKNRKLATQLPEMSVDEGIILKRQQSQFPREDLFVELKARDHVFLVDNDNSMKPYRQDLRMVLELLWAMVAKHDPDGPELYITTDMKVLKPKNDVRVLQELDSRPAKDAIDMRHCFAQIIEKYQDQFGTRNITSRFRHWKTTQAKGPRKLSLYVLTDGVWQTKTDLRQTIRTLVDHLIEHKLTNKQIGIQFIRFGNSERGMKRLETLDSGLNLGLDIIDTTPANDNVWKMLLGAVNDTFDDDPEDEENEEEVETEKANELPHGYRNNTSMLVGRWKANDRWG